LSPSTRKGFTQREEETRLPRQRKKRSLLRNHGDNRTFKYGGKMWAGVGFHQKGRAERKSLFNRREILPGQQRCGDRSSKRKKRARSRASKGRSYRKTPGGESYTGVTAEDVDALLKKRGKKEGKSFSCPRTRRNSKSKNGGRWRTQLPHWNEGGKHHHSSVAVLKKEGRTRLPATKSP